MERRRDRQRHRYGLASYVDTQDLAQVNGHGASELHAGARAVGFDDIPDALGHLDRGGVVGRIVATAG